MSENDSKHLNHLNSLGYLHWLYNLLSPSVNIFDITEVLLEAKIVWNNSKGDIKILCNIEKF